MKLDQAVDILTRPELVMQHASRPHKLAVQVFDPGRIGGTPCSEVTGIHVGFDWNAGKVLITTKEQLTRLSEEDLAAIRKSVSLGQSWHAYEEHKATLAKHDAVLQWLADEGAMIKNLLTQDGVRYTVAWPELGEEMADYFHSPTMAVQRAMLLAQQKDAPS